MHQEDDMIGVLVVHKEEGTRKLIRDMIIVRGDEYEVVMTENAGRALEAIYDDQSISLAIVDFQAIWPDCGVFAEGAKMFRRNVVIALAVDDPDEGGDRVDIKFKMMDLPARLDEFLAMAKSAA
ncbi:MAG: hypothetical protein AAB561_00250 [Patescibacteria group bacterium]